MVRSPVAAVLAEDGQIPAARATFDGGPESAADRHSTMEVTRTRWTQTRDRLVVARNDDRLACLGLRHRAR